MSKIKTKQIVFLVSIVVVLSLSMPLFGADSYYPLDKDRVWVYHVSAQRWMSSARSLKLNVTNFASRKLNGKQVVPQQVSASGSGSFHFVLEDKTGICEYASQSSGDLDPKIKSPPEYYIKYPIRVGTTWKNAYKTALLEEEIEVILNYKIVSVSEDVTVPAGTFNKCLRIQASGNTTKDLGPLGRPQVTVEYYSWYAPGVGLIKQVIKEKTNHMLLGSAEASLQLESFTE